MTNTLGKPLFAKIDEISKHFWKAFDRLPPPVPLFGENKFHFFLKIHD